MIHLNRNTIYGVCFLCGAVHIFSSAMGFFEQNLQTGIEKRMSRIISILLTVVVFFSAMLFSGFMV